MKKILSLILAVIMIASVFTAVPVMAEEDVVVLNENFGKVKIMGKTQSDGSIAFGVRSSFGKSETQDIIQYFISPRGNETSYGMENHQAFDFSSSQELVSKTSSTVFSSGTKYGGDERTPASLSGFGWIGAGHGMTCAVNVTGEHGLTYANVGDIYKDKDNKEWVLLRVTEVKSGSVMVPSLVFISKNLKSGRNDTNPAFETMTEAHLGTDLVNVNDANNKVTINKYSNSSWLKPAYNMTKQDVYVVNDGEKTLVQADGVVSEGDYVLVEETYTIMNPAHVAQAIIDGKPEGGYTENPNLAVGKPLVTFDLQQIYNADGTVIHNWETTYHQDVSLGEFGGIQYGKKGDFVYLPGTKPFIMNSSVTINNVKEDKTNVAFDFTNLFDTTKAYPNGYATTETFADLSNVPHRRLDFNKSGSTFDKAFAGGQLPVFDGAPEERVKNTDRAFYFWNTRKAYHFSVGGSKSDSGINKRYPDLTDVTLKGSGYKKWIQDFDANGTSSFYSVPYFSDGDNSRYFYFDLYQPGVTKKYDVSAYLGTYSISKLEQSANLEYSIDYEKGILTVSSLENNQTSADYLVLKAKYVGESVPAVEMKLRALPTLYSEAINDKLAEIAELMESVGAPESDYAPELIEKYKSLLAQKEAYEQAIKDEAANADRVAGLNNRYEYVEMNFPHDAFATDNDFAAAGWYGKELADDTTNPLVYKGFNMQSYGTLSQPAKDNGVAYRASEIENTPGIEKGEDGRYIYTIKGVPFKLGEIETQDGKIGANAVIFRRQLKADGYTGTEPLNTLSSEYKMEGASGITTVTYPLNKDGISNVNLLLSDIYVGGNLGENRFNTVTVKYADGEKVTFNSVFNKGTNKFPDTVFAVPVETFNAIKNDTTKADTVPTVKEVKVDTYKAYVAKYVDQATADAVTKVPSGWSADNTAKAVYAGLVADSKYQALLNVSPVKANTLIENIDAEKFEGISSGDPVTLPTKTEQFVPARLKTTYTANYNTTYMSNTVIPTDSTKTIESVTVSGGLNESGPAILASGGFYSVSTYGVHSGALMLKYDGSETITIDGTEYVLFVKLTRQCGDSALYGMTLTREQTWLDRIASVEAKMLALNEKTSTYADVEALRSEIASLLVQNTSIIYVKDFSQEARDNIDNVEAALKASADEEDRIENLSKNVFNHVDMNKYGVDDIYVTDEDFKTAGSRQFGYNNTLTGILPGCTAVDKAEGGTAYKEYYTKDNYLLAVLDVANNTYYYNGMNTTIDKDVYEFLGKKYQIKYVADTKTYYYKSAGAEKSSTSSQGGLYAWYHDGVGAYYEMSDLAKNKAINTGNSTISGDELFTLLTNIKDYTAKDLLTGKEITAKTGTLKANGTEFVVGPFAPSKTATANGIMLNENLVILPFGEEGVKADYINILANIFTTDAVNTSYMKVEVDYENEDGSLGKKSFAVVLPKTGYAGSTNTSVQGVVDSSIFRVEKTKDQSTYDKVFNNKEATTGISVNDITFNTKVENIMIYPSEVVNIGKKYTQHSWWPNAQDNYAGAYKLPVSDLYKVLAVRVSGNGGASGNANKDTSDLYVEGAMVASNGRAAIPVEVEGGDENYNYYAIYSPTWANRSTLYAVNTEKTPAIAKISAIEEKMAVAKSAEDVEEIESLIANLTSDGAVVYPKDFDKEIVDAYEALKETIDVSAEVEVVREGSKVTVKAKINNATGMEGKKFTVVVTFRDSQNTLRTKAYPFETKGEKKYAQNVVISNVPEEVTEIKAFVWKDLITLKPLTK